MINSFVNSNYLDDRKFDASICPTLVVPLEASSTFLTRGSNVYSSVNNVYSFNVRALMDSGSSTCWIAPDILDYVKHQTIGNITLNVKTFNSKEREKYKLVEIYTNSQYLPSFRCFVMKKPSEAQIIGNLNENLIEYFSKHREKENLLSDWINPYDHNNIDHDVYDSVNYGLILSSSVINKIVFNKKFEVKDCDIGVDVLLTKTCFGVTVSGNIPPKRNRFSHINYKTQVEIPIVDMPYAPEHLFSEDHCLRNELSILWDKETLGIYDHELHNHDEAAIASFKNTVRKDPLTGQYEVGLPFNNRKNLLKNNFSQAFARAKREQINMINDSEYKELFSQALNTLIENNYIEKVLNQYEPVIGPVVYLPYRGIIRKEHTSTKCRIVMDASAKPSINDFSLNQALYKGPNHIADLAQCLLRFMLGRYACVADIKQAFLRIWIRNSDRDAQRFVVAENIGDRNSKFICYRYTSVMFGSVASPFLLAAVLEKHIEETCKNEVVRNALLHNTYVDNVSFATSSESVIDTFFTESIPDMAQGGFELRQWASNSKKLMSAANVLNIADNDNEINILGMVWNILEDNVSVKVKIKWDGKFTKRSVLAATMSIFDPLCLLGPIEIQNHLFLQVLWDLGYEWDESFEHVEHLKSRWLYLLAQCQQVVETFKFPREIVFMDNSEIHVFCDASNTSYGAAVYISTPPNDTLKIGSSKLILSKGKIKPLKGSPKGNTIPKLELTAMLLGAGLGRFVKSAFKLTNKTKTFLWSDAKVVLDWLSSTDLESTYVHRRVVDIRTLCPNAIIKHVPTTDNPADVMTRPVTVKKFMQNRSWWHGPTWLIHPKSQWPHETKKYTLHPSFARAHVDDKSHTVNINFAIVQAFDTMSSYDIPGKLILTPMKRRYATMKNEFLWNIFKDRSFKSSIKIMIHIIKFIYNNKKFHGNGKIESSDLSRYDFAKLLCLKLCQRECFPYELQTLLDGKNVTSGPCSTFGLVLDSFGIMRCSAFRHAQVDPLDPLGPILVAPEHIFVSSYIYSKHFHSNCSSKNYTLNKVKREMHGPGVRSVVNSIVKNCLLCKEARSKYLKFKYPTSPKLPDFRTTFIAPFASCGVDLAGPFLVLKDTYHQKVWIVLFSCLVTRATYLVIVSDLKASTFMRALLELCARHSTPLILVSDNATNFACTSRILERIKNDLDVSLHVPLEWKFIPVKAPWVGGIYERIIGIMKSELLKMTRGACLTYIEFKSHVIEIERVLNNRPLQQVGDSEVITPNMLVYGRKVDVDGNLSSIQIDTLLKNSKLLSKKLPAIYADNVKRKNEFWRAFQAQYLDLLKFKTGIKESGSRGRIPRLGDLVMIYDSDPRIKPKKALITKVIESDDGEIRKCKVKLGNKESIRPICSFRDLEMNIYDPTDIGVRQNGGNHRYNDGLFNVLLSKSSSYKPSNIVVDQSPPQIIVSPPRPICSNKSLKSHLDALGGKTVERPSKLRPPKRNAACKALFKIQKMGKNKLI